LLLHEALNHDYSKGHVRQSYTKNTNGDLFVCLYAIATKFIYTESLD